MSRFKNERRRRVGNKDNPEYGSVWHWVEDLNGGFIRVANDDGDCKSIAVEKWLDPSKYELITGGQEGLDLG